MTWNYRVIRRECGNEFCSYALYEVYYNKDGTINSWTEDAVEPCGETLEGLADDLRRMQTTLEKPILQEAMKGDVETLEEVPS